MTTASKGATASSSKFATVLRVTGGNFMEMFDFFLFGFYATQISKAFFPAGDEFASLMLTFMTFGASFLMRPLGAIFLGAYVDRVGRRKGLIVTLALMALGTLLIACVPSYATIGFAAPLLVLIGRPQDGWLATWSRADAVVSHPLDPRTLAKAAAELLKRRIALPS